MNSDHLSPQEEPETFRESGFWVRFWSVTFQLYRVAAILAWGARFRTLTVAAVLFIVALILMRLVDPLVMRWLATWQTIQVVKLAEWLSFLGQIQMVPLALIFGLWIWSEMIRRPDGRIALGATAIAMALGGVMVQLPKFIFGRPRPHFDLPDQFSWFHPEWNSFPSGHATHWFALVGALWAFSPRISLLVVPLAIIAALARVLARAHYPSDIIAGAGFGLFFGLFFGLAARSINLKLGRITPIEKRSRTSAPLGID